MSEIYALMGEEKQRSEGQLFTHDYSYDTTNLASV
jgi:hypothetical protein